MLDELLRIKTVAQYTHRDRMRLYASFVAHARFDPELLRQELELPPEYDQNDPREARKPSYRNLPVDLILFWIEKLDNWRDEPVIQSQVKIWQRSLPALRNTPAGAEIRRGLKRIDPDLVPERARGAGRYGTDKAVADWFYFLEPVVKQLHDLYKEQQGSLLGSPENDRRKKINQLYDELMREHRQWAQIIESMAVTSKADSDQYKQEACAILDIWIPVGRERAGTICRRYLAALTGLSEQSVINALKREKRRRKNTLL